MTKAEREQEYQDEINYQVISLKKRKKEATDKIDKIFSEDTGSGIDGWNNYLINTKSLREEVSSIQYQIDILEPSIFEDIPEYGDHMTMEDFKGYCESGMFIDYDGSGNYATADKMTQKTISPSDFEEGLIIRNFTHVVWFNR